MSPISDRIFCLLQERGIEQKEFAGQIGVSEKTVSAWKTGRSKSYTKYLPKISEALGIPAAYLLEGGDMVRPPGEEMPVDALAAQFKAIEMDCKDEALLDLESSLVQVWEKHNASLDMMRKAWRMMMYHSQFWRCFREKKPGPDPNYTGENCVVAFSGTPPCFGRLLDFDTKKEHRVKVIPDTMLLDYINRRFGQSMTIDEAYQETENPCSERTT